VSIFNKIKSWFYTETWALPLDIFRVIFGFLCICYFYSLFNDIADFSSQNGLINHDYFLKHWWFLKINLIPPDPSDLYFKIILGSATVFSSLLMLGIYPRFISFLLFLAASTVQKWNFSVIYVDDVAMHLVLFWLILLPSGTTLNIIDYIKNGSGSWKLWANKKIPDIGIKLFLLNICWIYFYAGMEKIFSEMWYTGFALYPILLIPISRVSEYIKPEHLEFIRIATYSSLLVEVILPFLLLLRKGSRLKYLGLLLMVSFHLFIISTLRIPFANIAMMGSSILFFREELMDYFHKNSAIIDTLGKVKKFNYSAIFAIIFFILVITSTTRHIPYVKAIAHIPTQVLWVAGVMQNYQLFDWINRFNFKIEREVFFIPAGNDSKIELDHKDFLPDTVRYNLFQLRFHDVRWLLRIGGEKRHELKRDIPKRIAANYCRKLDENGEVFLSTTIHRITEDNFDFKKKPRVVRYKFNCVGGKAKNGVFY